MHGFNSVSTRFQPVYTPTTGGDECGCNATIDGDKCGCNASIDGDKCVLCAVVVRLQYRLQV
ncbi:hypothetical protein [Nostoc sp.]|uniref:hypothetical protein n=1 Tax=Nostoc sp. TaxID=1180 RepID=UPI002FF667AD